MNMLKFLGVVFILSSVHLLAQEDSALQSEFYFSYGKLSSTPSGEDYTGEPEIFPYQGGYPSINGAQKGDGSTFSVGYAYKNQVSIQFTSDAFRHGYDAQALMDHTSTGYSHTIGTPYYEMSTNYLSIKLNPLYDVINEFRLYFNIDVGNLRVKYPFTSIVSQYIASSYSTYEWSINEVSNVPMAGIGMECSYSFKYVSLFAGIKYQSALRTVNYTLQNHSYIHSSNSGTTLRNQQSWTGEQDFKFTNILWGLRINLHACYDGIRGD